MKQKDVFLFSLGLSLFVFLTSAGLVAVDAAGRRLSFGDERPPFQRIRVSEEETDLRVLLFDREAQVDITKMDCFFNFLLDFCCIPHN